MIEDLVYSQGLRAIGLVGGVGAAPKEAPRENLTTDPYYTSGLRTVLLFDSEPTSLAGIEFLRWEPFGGGIREPDDRGIAAMSMLAADRRSARHLAWLACVLAVLSGCATWNMPVDTSDTPFRARAITETKGGVQLSATVLDAEDSLRLFGTDVTAAGIQPVWIEVRNDTEQVFWLLRSGTDPDYFSPLEVAWSAHVKLGGDTNERIDEHFDRLAFPNPIPAHGASSGILFTNPQPVTKLLNVDLLGNRTMVPFTLFLPVRGDVARAGELIHRYADAEITRYDDLEALRRALENLPCCAATADGDRRGRAAQCRARR